MADPYLAQVAATLPEEHPLKSRITSSLDPGQLARLREFASTPPSPVSFGVHESPAPVPVGPLASFAPGLTRALASTPLPPANDAAPAPPPVITMPEQVMTAPAAPAPAVQAPAPGPSIVRGGVSGARERPNRGPTQARLIGESYDELRGTAEKVREAQKTQALNDAMAAEVRIEDARQREAEAVEARRRNIEQSEALRKDIDNATREVANGPERTELSGGNQALAAIAMAFGAFGAAYGGTGRNFAMEIIDRKIDRDVAQKRAQYEAKRNVLGAKHDAFGRLVQQYGMSGAESVWKAASAERLAAEADQLAARRGLSQADLAYQQTIGELNAKAEREKAASIDYIQAQGGQTMVFDPELGLAVPYGEFVKDALGRRRDREKAVAEGKDNVQGEVSELVKRREQAGIPKGEAALSRAQKDLAAAPEISKSKALVQDLVAGRKWLPEVVRQGAMSALYSKDEAAREQSHTMVVNKYINDVTGAGGGPEEMKRIESAAGAARTDPAARRRFYADMAEFYKAQDQNLRAGASPAARRRLDEALRSEATPVIKEY